MEGNYNNLFNYRITYSKTRKRTIAFKVENNMFNIISPLRVSKSFLLSFLDKKKDWVLERLSKQNQKRKLIENNKILFLGKEIDLVIIESDLLKNGGFCEFIENQLIISISKNWNSEILESIIYDWYKSKCLEIISNKVKYYSEKYNFDYGNIKIREQKTVWGTCNYKNDLSFNWKIILFFYLMTLYHNFQILKAFYSNLFQNY